MQNCKEDLPACLALLPEKIVPPEEPLETIVQFTSLAPLMEVKPLKSGVNYG